MPKTEFFGDERLSRSSPKNLVLNQDVLALPQQIREISGETGGDTEYPSSRRG